MRSYEVTYIVDSSLENTAIEATAKKYQNILTEAGCEIVAVDEMGLRQLAYPIKRRHSGVYYCVEFKTAATEIIGKAELQMRRDDSILRFLTVSLDKYGVKYNADKRDGKIGTVKRKVKEEIKNEKDNARRSKRGNDSRGSKSNVTADNKTKKEAPAKKDDLKKIEGIGPKIEEILNSSEVTTFAALAATSVETIREWLAAAGGRFAAHNPATWPKQADMAAKGNWAELKKWQDELDGGKVTSKEEE